MAKLKGIVNFFFPPKPDVADMGMRKWAEIEFGKDADYAYHFWKKTGRIPTSREV